MDLLVIAGLLHGPVDLQAGGPELRLQETAPRRSVGRGRAHAQHVVAPLRVQQLPLPAQHPGHLLHQLAAGFQLPRDSSLARRPATGRSGSSRGRRGSCGPIPGNPARRSRCRGCAARSGSPGTCPGPPGRAARGSRRRAARSASNRCRGRGMIPPQVAMVRRGERSPGCSFSKMVTSSIRPVRSSLLGHEDGHRVAQVGELLLADLQHRLLAVDVVQTGWPGCGSIRGRRSGCRPSGPGR